MAIHCQNGDLKKSCVSTDVYDLLPILSLLAWLSMGWRLARRSLGWSDRLSRAEALEWTGDWYRVWLDGGDCGKASRTQLAAFRERAQ